MSITGLHTLHGRSVLVRRRRDRHNPPAAMRGTIEVREASEGARVTLELDYPQMFTRPAHHRTLLLCEAEIEEMIQTEHDGIFEFSVDGELE